MQPCLEPGCGTLVERGRCAPCRREWEARKRQRRGSAAYRGYGRRWRKARHVWLVYHPTCEVCKQSGKLTAAVIVDHVVPVTGATDPLFWNADNWQSLCRLCDNRKKPHDQAIRALYDSGASLADVLQFARDILRHDSHMIAT